MLVFVDYSPIVANSQQENKQRMTTEDTSIVSVDSESESMSHLIPVLPHLARQLSRTKRLAPGELEEAVNQLDSKQSDNFRAMLARMNPEKPGVHLAQQAFRVPEMRIYHGTGNDESRPPTAPEGSIYSSDSRLLVVPETHRAMFPTVGQKAVAAVVGVYNTRTFWAPREDSGASLPPGVELKGNQPICNSFDRQRGNRYGSCSACPYRPWKDGKMDKNSCRDELHLYLVLRDFSGIYRFIVSGTSMKSGGIPVMKKVQSWAAPWSYYFSFATTKITKDKMRWFQLESSVATDQASPEGIAPSDAEQRVLSLLCRQIETEAYYPALGKIYERSNSAPVGETSADLSKMIEQHEGAQADYSANNV